MPLKEEFERSGNWLFQRRSYLPLVLYVFALLIMYLYRKQTHRQIIDDEWAVFCLAVSMLGQVVRALTIGFTPKGTSGRNTAGQVAEQLNQTGVYSLVRHPLYLGNYLMWLGLFLYVGPWWFVLICSLAFWLYYERIMFSEEEFLRRKYGMQYVQWATRTPAFLPRFSGWEPARLPFSLRNVLKREYNGIFAMLLSFAALNAISYFFARGVFYADALWQVLFVVALVFFLLMRFLKKNTHLLDISGR